MTLQEWIKQQGGQRKCAKKHSLPPASVGAWYRLERYPRPETQQRLSQLSGGKIDFRRLMKDYLHSQQTKKTVAPADASNETPGKKHVIDHEQQFRQLLNTMGIKYSQSDWQVRLIYASWTGMEITQEEIKRAASRIKCDGGSIDELFLIHQVITQKRRKFSC